MYIRPCDSMQNCFFFFLSFFPFFFFFFIFSILLYYLFSYIPSFIFSPTNLPIHTNLFDRFLFFILTFLSSQPRPEKLDSKTYSGIFFCAAPIERENRRVISSSRAHSLSIISPTTSSAIILLLRFALTINFDMTAMSNKYRCILIFDNQVMYRLYFWRGT